MKFFLRKLSYRSVFRIILTQRIFIYSNIFDETFKTMISEGKYLDALQIVRDYVKQINIELEKQFENEDFYWKSIYDFNFSVRCINALKGNLHYIYPDYLGEWQIRHIVCVSSWLEFRKFRNMGNKSITELKDFFEEKKLTIGQPKERYNL